MARKRQNQKTDTTDILDLGASVGLTLLKDSTSAIVDDWIPTMFPALDYILGGGIPMGRVTEIFGKEQSGKSTLAVHLTKQSQAMDIPVVWIDVEGTASPDNLEQLGVDSSKVFIIQPDDKEDNGVLTIEGVTDRVEKVVEAFADADQPIMMIWDSLASTASRQEMKEGVNPNQIGMKAKAITHMTTRIGQKINQSRTAFIVLNQARDDMSNPMFPTIKSTGGRAMEHWGSVRMEVAKASQIKEKVVDPVTGKESDQYIGHIFRLKTKKSKVSTPNRQAELFLISEPYKGLDIVENVYRSAVEQFGLISKGTWRTYVSDDGEEFKMYHKDWVPFLSTEAGYPILKELFQKEMLKVFPNGFAPLDNINKSIDCFPLYEGLRERYESQRSVTESLDEA